MRGKAGLIWPRCAQMGITPACAGKRAPSGPGMALLRDHPRVCGEKLSKNLFVFHSLGSPPRVRGKVSGSPAAWTGARDHPRVCGEKRRPGRRCRRLKGSPPRVRGKVPVATPNPMPVRITPACAGKRLTKSHYCAIFVLPFSAVHSVYDRAQAPGNNLATPCGWTAAPEKSTRPGSQVYSLEHHPLRAEPDQADRGSG